MHISIYRGECDCEIWLIYDIKFLSFCDLKKN